MKKMLLAIRCLGVTIFVLALLCPGARADDTLAIAERLHRAQVATSLDQASITPWHLKLATTLLDNKGKVTDEGTIEEWWLAPDHWKVSFATSQYTMTEVQNSGGFFRTAGVDAPPLLLDLLLRQMVHPMPLDSEIDESKPEVRKENFGKVSLDCIMLDQPLKTIAYPPMGLFPTYCFNTGGDELRVSYDFGSQNIVRNRMGTFQKLSISQDLGVTLDGVLAASSHTLVLTGLPASTPEFDTSGLESFAIQPARVAGGVMQGMVLKKVPPFYPEDAKRKHIEGKVILKAIIGRDGHVHSLHFVSVPDSSLGIAAIAAVRQWTYKPYLLNGVATEVDTTITVNFAINRN